MLSWQMSPFLHALKGLRGWDLDCISVNDDSTCLANFVTIDYHPICGKVLARNEDASGACANGIYFAMQARDDDVGDNIRTYIWISAYEDGFSDTE